MTRHTILADVLVVGLLLAAVQCRPAPEKPPDIAPSTQGISSDGPHLGGTSWRLVKFQGGDGLTLTPNDKAKYTIAFGTDGRLSARIDCNRGRGTWKSSGPPQLEFGRLALTRAMCPPGSLHDHMVKHWPYVRSYVMKDGHLFLSLMADGGIYEFEPASPEENVKGAVRPVTEPLENTYWKLTLLGDAPVTAAYRRPEPHLIINSVNRSVGGHAGCNRFTGSYDLKGDRLHLGRLVATLMACAEGMETERAFLDALGRVNRWRIAGQQLELLDAAGNVVARFEARHME
jgi:heat shock protein HslJ